MSRPQFDTNGDGVINSSDQIANGLLLGNVYAAAPVIVKVPCSTNCKRDKLITESSGAIQNVAERGATATTHCMVGDPMKQLSLKLITAAAALVVALHAGLASCRNAAGCHRVRYR